MLRLSIADSIGVFDFRVDLRFHVRQDIARRGNARIRRRFAGLEQSVDADEAGQRRQVDESVRHRGGTYLPKSNRSLGSGSAQ